VSTFGQAGDPETLVVATPERVAFRFETAGLGSRFVAQVIDLLVLAALLIALVLASMGLIYLTSQPTPVLVALLAIGFLGLWAYLIVPEAVWSGQTLGKFILHLRVIDAGGGPLSAGQAVVRNLFRIVDFLPVYYAAGAVAIFVSPRNQRLGDLAAGTVVVRERMAVRLSDLAVAPAPGGAAGGGAGAYAGSLRRLDPALKRFVVAYAQRRAGLPAARREQLASEVEPALRGVLPDVVATRGALAALDQLADEEVRG
jgi:uncharacterized RDD family membrane protein YckC